jgi:hypothetical protein
VFLFSSTGIFALTGGISNTFFSYNCSSYKNVGNFIKCNNIAVFSKQTSHKYKHILFLFDFNQNWNVLTDVSKNSHCQTS